MCIRDRIKTTPKELTVPKIEQIYFEVKEKMKLEALCRLIDLYLSLIHIYRNKITKKGCIGAPTWVIEIVSSGTSRRDYLTKLSLYADYGVKEYWIVNPMNETITVYRLVEELTPAVYTLSLIHI